MKIFIIKIMNRYISNSYTTSKNTIYRQYTERGRAAVVLIVNLSILNHFNLTIKILVNSGLIEIFLFSNCFTYILEGDVSNSIEPGCVSSFCRTKSIEFD